MSYTEFQLHQAEVFISEVLESHGIPDHYVWRLNQNGKLIPEHDDTPIEEIVSVDNPIRKLELNALSKIQERAQLMEDGDYIFWISPIHWIYYPKTSKIIITQKVEDIFVNKAITINWDTLGCILAAKELARLTDDINPDIFKDASSVRTHPIFVKKDKEDLVGLILQQLLNQKSIEMMATGDDLLIKRRYVDDLLSGRAVVMGQHPRSCDGEIVKSTGPFQVFAGEDEYGSLQFECPHCHETNTRERGKLLSNCQHCGSDVRCKA